MGQTQCCGRTPGNSSLPATNTTLERSPDSVAFALPKIYSVGGIVGGKESDETESYDTVTDTWTELPAEQKLAGGGRMGHAAVVVGNGSRLFVLGGVSKGVCLASCECLDLTDPKAKWKAVSAMSHPRIGHSAVVVGTDIFVLGGATSLANGAPISSVERYDTVSGKWMTTATGTGGAASAVTAAAAAAVGVAPMLHARRDFGCCEVNGLVYVMGGAGAGGSSSGDLKSVEVYDPSTNKWSALAPMSLGRSFFTASAIGDRIYACGGLAGQKYLSAVERYDISDNQWMDAHPMHGRKRNAASCVVGGKLFVMGGFGDEPPPETKYPLPASTASTASPQPPAAAATRAGSTGATTSEDITNSEIFAPPSPDIKSSTATATAAPAGPPKRLATVEMFDPSRGVWTLVAAMHSKRANLAVAR